MASGDIFRASVAVTTDVAINNMPTVMLQDMLGEWVATFTEFSNRAGQQITDSDKKKPFQELDCYVAQAFSGATINDYLALYDAIRTLLRDAKETIRPVRDLDLGALGPVGKTADQGDYLKQLWKATCTTCSPTVPGSLSGLLQEVAQLPHPSMSQLLGYAALALNRTLAQSTDDQHPCRVSHSTMSTRNASTTNSTENHRPVDYTVEASVPFVNVTHARSARQATMLMTKMHYSVAYKRGGLSKMDRVFNYLHSALPQAEAARRELQLGVELDRDDAVGIVRIDGLTDAVDGPGALAQTTSFLEMAAEVQWDVTALLRSGQRLATLTSGQLKDTNRTTTATMSGKLLTEFYYGDFPTVRGAQQSPEMAFRVAFPQTKTAHRDIKDGVGTVRWEAETVIVHGEGVPCEAGRDTFDAGWGKCPTYTSHAPPRFSNNFWCGADSVVSITTPATTLLAEQVCTECGVCKSATLPQIESVVHADVAWTFLVDGDVVEVYLKEENIPDDKINPNCATGNGDCIAYQWLVVPECQRDVVRHHL